MSEEGSELSNLEFYSPGAHVYINKDVRAIVIRVCVSSSDVEYECAWWDGRNRIKEWVSSNEVKCLQQESRAIGFNDARE